MIDPRTRMIMVQVHQYTQPGDLVVGMYSIYGAMVVPSVTISRSYDLTYHDHPIYKTSLADFHKSLK